MNNEEIIGIFDSFGLRSSQPRMIIYGFLWEHRIHPTVEDIYSRLHPRFPALSKTTVYNTVKCFVDKGLLHPVLIEDNELRYDIDTSVHGHFKCEDCGKVYDFAIDAKTSDPFRLCGFRITGKHFYYRGICKTCSISTH